MQDYIIIGSVAANHWFADFRKPKNDIDILCSVPHGEYQSFICVPDKYYNLKSEHQYHASAEYILGRKEHGLFMIPDELYTLKVSHAHWNIKFEKTLQDIAFFKSKGCLLDLDMYNHLVKTWEGIHGDKSKVNLNKTVDEFFSDNINRIYPHEYLHQEVKFYDKPMHEYIKQDGSEVLCSEIKFWRLSNQQRIDCCLEEIIVTAIERGRLSKVSLDGMIRSAIIKAHKKLCTSMTKGWYARYLIMNCKEILVDNKDRLQNKTKEVLTKIQFPTY